MERVDPVFYSDPMMAAMKAIWNGVPWGSILKITSGDWYIRRLIGRLIKTTKYWAIPMLNPDAATDLSVSELKDESRKIREEFGLH